MKSLLTTLTATLALGLAAAAGPVAAQLSQNNKAPVDVTGDHNDVFNEQCLSVWTGSVEALQDNARLRTDTLKIFMAKKAKAGSASGACGDLDRIEALGSVYYMTPEQRVHGNAAVYEAQSTTLTVTGDVTAVRDKNVMRGERMVINTQTGEGHMVGVNTGRNQPNRVRGVFYPNQSDNPDAGAAKPAAGKPR
ncbi:LptA/OstA family protein [Phenylobacterium sp.]|uniref:LptA/OstA family protein n=1 Tax=Phenylobacterium sp. TaxID=1871053 RepID=UPI002DEAF15A|nr:LptA/OstA family protein [Phenylobacterium sp.]